MNTQDLIAKFATKGVSGAEVEQYLTSNNIEANAVEAKMIDAIASSIVKNRPGVIAVGGGVVAKTAPIAPVTATTSAAGRRPGRNLPVKRQEKIAQQAQDLKDQRNSAQQGYEELQSFVLAAADEQIEDAVAESRNLAQEVTTAKISGFVEGMRQGEEVFQHVVSAAITAGRSEQRRSVSEVVKEAIANQPPLFDDEWLTSLLG